MCVLRIANMLLRFSANYPAEFFLVFPLQSVRVSWWALHYVEALTLEFLNGVTPYDTVFTAWILTRLVNIAVSGKQKEINK